MKTNTHGNGMGLNDLYLLPESREENSKIMMYLRTNGINYRCQYSDVEGQEWYGNVFIELPFGESHLDAIKKLLTA